MSSVNNVARQSLFNTSITRLPMTKSSTQRSSSLPRNLGSSGYRQIGRHHYRRGSHDETLDANHQFLVEVGKTIESLLQQEDTDNDTKITTDDTGPKSFQVDALHSEGTRPVQIRGTYMLANLLQELLLAQENGLETVDIKVWQLGEDPVSRLNRLIKEMFWDSLTRQLDASGIEKAAPDPKMVNFLPRIYIPHGAPEQFAHYSQVAQERPSLRLDVQLLPEGEITPEFIKSLNQKPGVLALEMDVLSQESSIEPKELKGVPFIVPGGRFNELYNWDGCFCTFGMLDSHAHLVKSIIRNFAFQIKHYGKILNANRSYYLGRSQPPFLTDLALRTYEATQYENDARDLLKLALLAARKEYHTVWMAEPRYDKVSGLSRYRPIGSGLPPECEPRHFEHALEPYMKKYKMTLEQFTQAYNDGDVHEPDLDEFCLHDRAIRESGHDTSYRLENVAADLATVDLNCLLYRYETDLAYAVRTVFGDHLEVPSAFCVAGDTAGHIESSAIWDRRARKRKVRMNKFMWNEDKGIFFDYNTVAKKQHVFESVTCLWALWCGVANPRQAALLVNKGLPLFEFAGGLSAGTDPSAEVKSATFLQKQWDYPHGWAPHQVLAWDGLRRYGYYEEAERVSYRWLHMVSKIFAEHNGTVVEKYNVTQLHDCHKVSAEYGNQGVSFKGVSREGFGWTNGSFAYGLSHLSLHAKRALGVCAPYEVYAKAIGLS